jgi:hypothetical protein
LSLSDEDVYNADKSFVYVSGSERCGCRAPLGRRGDPLQYLGLI